MYKPSDLSSASSPLLLILRFDGPLPAPPGAHSVGLGRCGSVGHGGAPGTLHKLALYPGAAGEHAVPTLRYRGGQGAFVPPAGRQSHPGHGPETERVSFMRKS